MAIFSRTESSDPFGLRIELQPFGYRPVATVSRYQVARHAADGRDADAGLPMNFAVGKTALEKFYDSPPIRHRLQLSRRTKVAEKTAALLNGAQREDGGA